MPKKSIILIAAAVLVLIAGGGAGYLVYRSRTAEKIPENNSEKGITAMEQSCIDSEGEVSTSLCCESAIDFPNNCFIGACGCYPDNSHEIKVCNCGENMCFDGEKCVEI